MGKGKRKQTERGRARLSDQEGMRRGKSGGTGRRSSRRETWRAERERRNEQEMREAGERE